MEEKRELADLGFFPDKSFFSKKMDFRAPVRHSESKEDFVIDSVFAMQLASILMHLNAYKKTRGQISYFNPQVLKPDPLPKEENPAAESDGEVSIHPPL